MEEKTIPLAISDSLSGMLDQLTEGQKQQVGQRVQGLMHEYKKHLKENKHNRVSIAASWQDYLQEALKKQVEENDARGDHTVSCSKGCSHCCYQNVDITDDEAQLITDYAEEEGIAIDIDHLARQLVAKQTGGNDGFNKLPYADRACVFLDDEGGCQIYKYRPLVCRKLLVASDPEQCDTKKGFGGMVTRLVGMEAEVITCAVMNGCDEAESMAKMLFKEKDRRGS